MFAPYSSACHARPRPSSRFYAQIPILDRGYLESSRETVSSVIASRRVNIMIFLLSTSRNRMGYVPSAFMKQSDNGIRNAVASDWQRPSLSILSPSNAPNRTSALGSFVLTVPSSHGLTECRRGNDRSGGSPSPVFHQ
jgi:hypothetical protein